MNQAPDLPTKQTSSAMKRWVLVSSVLLMVLTHLLLDLHELDHLSDGDEETCVVCLTGGATAHALVGDLDIAWPGFSDDRVFTFRTLGCPFTVCSFYHPRAPPQSAISA